MLIQRVYSPQDLFHAWTEAADPRGPVFLERQANYGSLGKGAMEKCDRVRVNVRAAQTWRVGSLPRALGDPGTLGNAKGCH